MSELEPAMNEIDLLLDNARLRDELEPYVDESFQPRARMPLSIENEYLASMLAWERAPALPISHWFEPILELPRPDALNDTELSRLLGETMLKLRSVRLILECTEHLSDRQLYTIIFRDILPCWEKKVDLPNNFLYWRCLNDDDDETWLRYYATAVERRQWQERTGQNPPSSEPLPYPRNVPRG